MTGPVTKELLVYETSNGKAPFEEWLSQLKDTHVRARIWTHLVSLGYGHTGKSRMLQAGVSELRIHFGPGYRVYYGEDRGVLIVLLCGGDKKSQPRDIRRALEYWRDYKVRR